MYDYEYFTPLNIYTKLLHILINFKRYKEKNKNRKDR